MTNRDSMIDNSSLLSEFEDILMGLITIFFNDYKIITKIAFSCIRKLHHPTTEAIKKCEGVAILKNLDQIYHL